MKRHQIHTRTALAIVVVLGASIGMSSCATPEGTLTELPPYQGLSPDPNDVPADDTDYSVDAGEDQPEYEYDDEPAPADTVLATLCNLNQTYFSGLREVQSGVPVVDDALRTNLVGLADLIAEWEGLREHVPEAIADLTTAEAIYENWDSAVLSHDNGDDRDAQEAMAEAEELLSELPENPRDYCRSR